MAIKISSKQTQCSCRPGDPLNPLFSFLATLDTFVVLFINNSKCYMNNNKYFTFTICCQLAFCGQSVCPLSIHLFVCVNKFACNKMLGSFQSQFPLYFLFCCRLSHFMCIKFVCHKFCMTAFCVANAN